MPPSCCALLCCGLLCAQGNPNLEEMKATAKYIAKRGKGILARWVLVVSDAVLCDPRCSCGGAMVPACMSVLARLCWMHMLGQGKVQAGSAHVWLRLGSTHASSSLPSMMKAVWLL